MTHLDDLPELESNFPIQETSVTAFQNVVSNFKNFVIQLKIQYDYGTDFWIEACEVGRMTNIIVCVQLKGTEKEENKDGSVSVPIKSDALQHR